MTVNRSIRWSHGATLSAMMLAFAVPAFAVEAGFQAGLAAVMGQAVGTPLADAELDAYRGAGLLDALAAVIAAVPKGYTAVVTIDGVTVGNPPGQTTPQSVGPITIGGTTASATTSGAGAGATSRTFTRSSTSASSRTYSYSR